MTGKKPDPITPEGKRAADRMRLIFLSIAAANVVVAVIVIWQRRHPDRQQGAEPPKPVAVEK